MSSQYAFSFDARYCSGCKACQAACKDKNNLPPGVLWRRVYEIAGGGWEKSGSGWNNSVFAYNLSIACNHCTHPKCAGICPVNAFEVREDGVVILDESKCMGCGYCAWGCPYGVPQYNHQSGRMTKCNFCLDQLEQGLPPACVAACPLRVLDYADTTSLPDASPNEIRLWIVPSDIHPYPLSPYSHTQPRLAIKQHPAMLTTIERNVANQEEVQPRRPSGWEDAPLMIFTLLGQMAVGSVWAMAWMFSTLWALVQFDTTFLRLLPVLVAGVGLGAGMLGSLSHLGTKKNAFRIFSNLRRSSLSKEVFFTALFGFSLLLLLLQGVILKQYPVLWTVGASAIGIGLIHHMAQVYRLPAAPGWNTWRTNVSFFLSAILLGISAMTPVLSYESNLTGIQIPAAQRFILEMCIVALLLGQLLLMRRRSSDSPFLEIRIGLILLGAVFAAATAYQSSLNLMWSSLLIFSLVTGQEAVGRWLFYRSRI